MGRNKINKSIRNKQKSYLSDNFYVCNISVAQALEPIEVSDHDKAKSFVMNIVVACIGCIMVAQISISARPESAEWVEKLESVKDIKQKIINGIPGLALASLIGLVSAFPYAREELEKQQDSIGNIIINFANLLVESHNANVKRIKPSSENWLMFARGEMSAAKGQLLSCPTTNLKTLNIDGQLASSYGVELALKSIGIDGNVLTKYEITPQRVIEEVRKILLLDKTGMPNKVLVYNEPDFVVSRLQSEIMGECVTRSAVLSNKLVKGVEPSFAVSKAMLAKYLSKTELFAYNIAIRTGDSQMAKKLSDIAIAKAKKKED